MVDKTKDIITEIEKVEEDAVTINNNKRYFPFEGNLYRVTMPNQKQNHLAKSFKNKRYIQLLQEENTLTLKQLTSVLKEKGINIAELDKQIKIKENELKQTYVTLYGLRDNQKKSIDKQEAEIKRISDERMEVVLEKAELLAPAIEHQAQDDYYRFLAAMCTEVVTNTGEGDDRVEEWNKVWKDFEDYETDDSYLTYVCLANLHKLMYGVE